jgi:hypothetical protein
MNKKKISLITFIMSFMYYLFPFIQYTLHDGKMDKYNDLFFFAWSTDVFVMAIGLNKTLVGVITSVTIVMLVSWLILFLLLFICFKLYTKNQIRD